MLICGEIILSAFLLVLFMNECQGCLTKLDPKFVKTGDSFFQDCSCVEKQDKNVTLKWTDPYGNEIALGQKPKSRIYTEKTHGSLALLIPKINKSLAGTYKCIAEYDEKPYDSASLDLQVYDPVQIYATPEEQYITKGRDSTIVCYVLGDEPQINWYKGGDGISEKENNDKYEIEPDGLLIKYVDDDDEGDYRCAASAVGTGDTNEMDIQVKVLTVPIIEIIKLSKERIVEGDYVTVECSARGKPKPEYIWTKILKDGNVTNVTNQIGDALVFESITEEDRGTYSCTAHNRAGNETGYKVIEVLVPPKIVSFSNKTAQEGQHEQLICIATGRPPPTINMHYLEDNRFDILDTSSINQSNSSDDNSTTYTLTFFEVKRTYEGHYNCEAFNSAGFDNNTKFLEVQYKPYFPLVYENVVWGWKNKLVNLSCEHDSNPVSTISWRFTSNIAVEEVISINKYLAELVKKSDDNVITLLIDKSSYFGTYECNASNSLGASNILYYLKEGFIPPAVDINNVTIKDTTASAVTFNIEGPYFDGPPITGYRTEYDDDNNYNKTYIHLNRTWALNRQFRVENLKASTKYKFRFAAINEVGDGVWSEHIYVETPAKSPPNNPELTHLEVTSGKTVIKWNAPESNGDSIDYYIIRYCVVENKTIIEDSCEEKELKSVDTVLTNLIHNATYKIQLIAHNAQGNSIAKEIKIVVPIPQPLPRLSAEATIIVSVVVVVFCIVIMDLVLCGCRKQGLFATCYYKKLKKRKHGFNSRDRNVLLKENNEGQVQDSTLKRNGDNNSNNDLEYNRPTGVITGKHSSV